MRRSLTGPLLLLIVGSLFLWKNLHPETPIFEMMARYWPFLLIGWGLLRLVEVALWREGRQGGFSGGEVVLVILICIGGSMVWAARENGIHFNSRVLNLWYSSYDYPVEAHASAVGAKRIVFENPRGSIKVTGSDTTEVTVTGHKSVRANARKDADRTNGNTPLEIVPQGDRLLIRTNQDHAPDNQQISEDMEVTVPRSVAVEASGRNGDYEISDVTGDLELVSDHGDVRLARVDGNVRLNIGRSDLIRAVDMKGRIDLQGRGSDVELENISGQVTINGAYTGTLDFKKLAKPLQFEGARNTELNVQAVPGHINMDLGEFNGTDLVGPVRLVGSSRDIRIEQFTQSLELENQRGDVELHPGRLPLPSIEARTGSGRIDLVLPEKAMFILDATAEHGEAVNDFGAPIQKESDGRSASLKGKVGDGPTLHIVSSRGSISVRKEGATPAGEASVTPAGKTPKPEKQLKELKELKEAEIKL
jgi:Putative adhesin